MANTTTDPWFVTERSEALAGLLLTSHNGVRIWKKSQLDDRLILHVAITGDPISPQLFVVQVKGAMSSDPTDWLSKIEPWFQDSDQSIWLPMCVFVVNVRENQAFYSWLAEPRVDGEVVGLRSSLTPSFHLLDADAVGQIVDQVRAYYQALPQRQLVPA